MKINDLIDFFKEPFERGKTHKAIDKEDTKLLLDYITNLQKENEELKKQIPSPDNYVPVENQTRITSTNILLDTEISEKINKYEDYKQRCENAIELVKSLIVFWKKYSPDNSMEIGQFENILNILKGVDEE